MEVKAIHRTARIAPRKARLVIDLIRGKNVKEAQAILMFTPRAASPIISKVLKSAVANAEHNNKLNVENLFVKEAYVSEGVTMKRMLPRAQGKGDIIQKRTSHITVIVAEREMGGE
ncbi:50S ribosomal protein L22 [Haploplasma axanthum]|uniref:Large ribosomal subunit protein uL22 n=1 Tax=Haploplasma axanthum TaxID=29552 RepID=A0A449BCD6_HAPAX|nr:50S ribosomal protein L22 [Haploplasma axanthum]VEU80095.1 50S ribosomal protein L22 [Haploplasma axanthum]